MNTMTRSHLNVSQAAESQSHDTTHISLQESLMNRAFSVTSLASLVLFIWAAANVQYARAATLEWAAGTGSWFVDSNWSPAQVPSFDDFMFVNNGGTIQIAAGAAEADRVRIGSTAGTNTLDITGGSLTIDGTVGLEVGRGGTLGTVNHSAGTVSMTGTGGVTMSESAADSDYNLSGTGSLSSNGLSMRGTSTFTMSSSGAVSLGNVGIGAASGTQEFNHNSGTVNGTLIDIAPSASSTGTYNLNGGVLNTTNRIDTDGAGTATFNLAGGTLNTPQILVGGGTFNFTSGTIDPGGISAVGATVWNSPTSPILTVPAGGTMHFDIAAAGTGGTDYDLFTVLSIPGAIDVTLGNLSVNLLGGFEPDALDTFTIIDSTSGAGVLGTFANAPTTITLNGLGGTMDVTYNAGTVVLSNYIAPVPEPSTALLAVCGLVGLVTTRRRLR